MLNLTFLGTAASVPSRDRMMSCVAVKRGADITLFDCAEGSQRQLMISPLSFMKINNIFITHLHGDHVLGLPGLLQTMGLSGRKEPVRVYGPVGIERSLRAMIDACGGLAEYELIIGELISDDVIEIDGATVTAFRTEHGVESLGYVYREADAPGRFNKAKAMELGIRPGPDFSRLQNGETVNGVKPDQVIDGVKKGVSIAFTGDTRPLKDMGRYVKDVDVLVHESTYMTDDVDLAKLHFHSTCKDAADTAAECHVGCLMLTHISNRYDDIGIIEAEAKIFFPNTIAVRDMDRFDISRKGVTRV